MKFHLIAITLAVTASYALPTDPASVANAAGATAAPTAVPTAAPATNGFVGKIVDVLFTRAVESKKSEATSGKPNSVQTAASAPVPSLDGVMVDQDATAANIQKALSELMEKTDAIPATFKPYAMKMIPPITDKLLGQVILKKDPSFEKKSTASDDKSVESEDEKDAAPTKSSKEKNESNTKDEDSSAKKSSGKRKGQELTEDDNEAEDIDAEQEDEAPTKGKSSKKSKQAKTETEEEPENEEEPQNDEEADDGEDYEPEDGDNEEDEVTETSQYRPTPSADRPQAVTGRHSTQSKNIAMDQDMQEDDDEYDDEDYVPRQPSRHSRGRYY